MKLDLDLKLSRAFKSPSQRARILTETWFEQEAFCPSCGSALCSYPNNQPVADFYCNSCKEDFELKSKKGIFSKRITDGAYDTMMERLNSQRNPNLFLLSYDLESSLVTDLAVIPKHVFIPALIQKRKPLSSKARRAGWIGCNIILESIPQAGRIHYIQSKKIIEKSTVLKRWKRTTFLGESRQSEQKGWILDIMLCVERLGKTLFTLDEVYQFENELKNRYPNNRHVKDKIRQQLQILRDQGFIEFLGRGRYLLLS